MRRLLTQNKEVLTKKTPSRLDDVAAFDTKTQQVRRKQKLPLD